MTLSDEATLKELDSWKRFIGALSESDGVLAAETLELGREYSAAIQARDSAFTAEPLFMSLLLAQHKEITSLAAKLERLKATDDARVDL